MPRKIGVWFFKIFFFARRVVFLLCNGGRQRQRLSFPPPIMQHYIRHRERESKPPLCHTLDRASNHAPIIRVVALCRIFLFFRERTERRELRLLRLAFIFPLLSSGRDRPRWRLFMDTSSNYQPPPHSAMKAASGGVSLPTRTPSFVSFSLVLSFVCFFGRKGFEGLVIMRHEQFSTSASWNKKTGNAKSWIHQY